MFPGIFRGIEEHKISEITEDIKMRVAQALADSVGPSMGISNLLPDSLDTRVSLMISKEMAKPRGKL